MGLSNHIIDQEKYREHVKWLQDQEKVADDIRTAKLEEAKKVRQQLNEAKNKIPQDKDEIERLKSQAEAIEYQAQSDYDDAKRRAENTFENVNRMNQETSSDMQMLQDVSSNIGGKIADNVRLSDSFYRDMGAAIQGKPAGNLKDIQADTYAAQAQNYKNRAANRDKEAQRAEQNASENIYSKAGKWASVQNDAENRQYIQGNAKVNTGSHAGLLRKTNTPDIFQQQQYKSEQEKVANERREEADLARERVGAAQGMSEELKLGSRDDNTDFDTESRLSMGEGQGETPQNTTTTDNTTPKDAQTPTDTTPEDNPDPVAKTGGNPHTVLNYMTYGLDQTSKNYNQAKMSDKDKALYSYLQQQGMNMDPITPDEAAKVGGYGKANEQEGALQQLIAQVRPDFWNWYKNTDLGKQRQIDTKNQGNLGNGVTQNQLDTAYTETGNTQPGYANGTDCATPGYHLVGERGPELVKFNGGEQVLPNEVLPDFIRELSDIRMKNIKDDWEHGQRPSEMDMMWLLSKAGKFKHGDRELDFNDNGYDDNEVLQAYADHIRNYVYNYKPEAQGVDPSIDSNEEHIGPMAQDIEQVNPACVQETPEGVKTVDTGRLAMMNAGAIADLARQMQEITDKLKALGV